MLTAPYTLERIPVETKLLPRAERRASILKGAAAAFARSGFGTTSMDDVAAACGVTKLIVYRHFETKEELYRAILQSVFDRLGQELAQGLAQGLTRNLGARVQLTVARDDPDGYRLLWRHAAREPMFADYAAQAREVSSALVRQLLKLDSGDDVVDRWKAELLMTYLIEATLAWLDGGDAARDEEFVETTSEGFRALLTAWR
ncbi:MAG TPA: TetR/AcrR family transcriptional regulator [Acidimicrobiales bacterium]